MKLRLSLIVSAVMLAVSSQTAVFAKDGTYTATTLGRNGDVTVQVRILNNKIEDVKVLNWSETHPVADLPKLKVPQDVVKYQSTNVNNVAGATLTTFAIKAAVQDRKSSGTGLPQTSWFESQRLCEGSSSAEKGRRKS